MPKLDCGTFEMHFEGTTGPGEPVVLVHGSFGDLRQWLPVAMAMVDKYRLVFYDRRGHGQSSAPLKSIALSDHVTDLETLISLVGRGPVHLVGNSYGGIVALQFAMNRPDLVRSVSLHEAPLIALVTDDPLQAAGVADFREKLESARALLATKDLPGAARRFVEGLAVGDGGWERLTPEFRQALSENVALGVGELLDPTSQSVDLELLPDLRKPLMLTAGSASLRLYTAIADRIASEGRSVSRFTFDGAGHLPQVTHATAFSDIQQRFFQWATESGG
ncbi:MAG: alpha/beta hydrolase [Thermoplasmata archaeon]|nr:alpha/beta hydrolase [Thermoplasmata archaeon]